MSPLTQPSSTITLTRIGDNATTATTRTGIVLAPSVWVQILGYKKRCHLAFARSPPSPSQLSFSVLRPQDAFLRLWRRKASDYAWPVSQGCLHLQRTTFAAPVRLMPVRSSRYSMCQPLQCPHLLQSSASGDDHCVEKRPSRCISRSRRCDLPSCQKHGPLFTTAFSE